MRPRIVLSPIFSNGLGKFFVSSPRRVAYPAAITTFFINLVSSEYIPCINFFLYVIKAHVIAVGDDCMALSLESLHVIHHLAAEESASVLKRWLIDNHPGSLCLDTLHDALDGTLAEVVRVGFHRKAINAYGA